MPGRVKQFVVYAKVTMLCLMAIGVVVVVVKNWEYKTRFWPGADKADVPTLWLMAATAVVSILAFWVFSKMRRIFRDLAQLRVERAQERLLAEQAQAKADLIEQERRIDQKIQKALGRGPEDR